VGIYWIPAVRMCCCLPAGVLWTHVATPLPIMKIRTRTYDAPQRRWLRLEELKLPSYRSWGD